MPVERGHVLAADSGIGGFATAIGRRRPCRLVAVLEAASDGGHRGACLGVQSSAVMALRALGIADADQETRDEGNGWKRAAWARARLGEVEQVRGIQY